MSGVEAETGEVEEIVSSEGANYGAMEVTEDKSISMTSVTSKSMMNFSLENVAQCVVPSMNRYVNY